MWQRIGLALVALALTIVPAAAQTTAQRRSRGAEAMAVERMAVVVLIARDALSADRADRRLACGDVLVAHRLAVCGGHPV
jgi:hypothetical protein